MPHRRQMGVFSLTWADMVAVLNAPQSTVNFFLTLWLPLALLQLRHSEERQAPWADIRWE